MTERKLGALISAEMSVEFERRAKQNAIDHYKARAEKAEARVQELEAMLETTATFLSQCHPLPRGAFTMLGRVDKFLGLTERESPSVSEPTMKPFVTSVCSAGDAHDQCLSIKCECTCHPENRPSEACTTCGASTYVGATLCTPCWEKHMVEGARTNDAPSESVINFASDIDWESIAVGAYKAWSDGNDITEAMNEIMQAKVLAAKARSEHKDQRTNEALRGHKTPGINPGVRVRIKGTFMGPCCVDGWVGPKRVRIRYGGATSEVDADQLEVVAEDACSDKPLPEGAHGAEYVAANIASYAAMGASKSDLLTRVKRLFHDEIVRAHLAGREYERGLLRTEIPRREGACDACGESLPKSPRFCSEYCERTTPTGSEDT